MQIKVVEPDRLFLLVWEDWGRNDTTKATRLLGMLGIHFHSTYSDDLLCVSSVSNIFIDFMKMWGNNQQAQYFDWKNITPLETLS